MPKRVRTTRTKSSTKKMTRTRKRTTTKRTTSKKPRLDPAVARDLHVYMNPFSTATQQPRIPDGKVSESLGTRSQVVTEVDANNLTSSAPPTLDILMFPGLGAGCLVFNTTADGQKSFVTLGYKDHGSLDFSGLPADSIGPGIVTTTDDMSKWRVVSQGLKISLINNQESNDGWWEACRISPEIVTSFYSLTVKGSSTDRVEGALTPLGLLSVLRDRDLVDNKTYKTGLLKDIHKECFVLHPAANEHDFCLPKQAYDLNAQNYLTSLNDGSGNPIATGLENTGAINNDLIFDNIDSSWDYTYIRLHPNTSPQDFSRFMLHLIGNHECVYPDTLRDSKYHVKSNVSSPDVMHATRTALRQNDSVSQPIMDL